MNKTASDQATTARIRDTLRRVLNLPPNTIMEYKTHTDSIKYVRWQGEGPLLAACVLEQFNAGRKNRGERSRALWFLQTARQTAAIVASAL